MRGTPVPVLHVIAPAPFGGAESVVRALAAASRSAGRPFHVAALLQDPAAAAPFTDELRAEGARVTEISCGRRRYLAEARAVARTAREQGIAVVHTHVYHADFVGWRAARTAGLPVVATVHGFTGGGPGNRLYEWMDRRLLRRFEAAICVSESVREALLRSGCPAERLRVITNGFVAVPPLGRDEARRALGVEGGRVVGWVGRFSVEKGADLFVDAFARVEVPGAQAVLVGDGPERAGVEVRAAASRAAGRVRFAGPQPRAARLLPALDVLVLSSRTEGTPMVLLEAMAAGVPIVAFAVGGVGRVVDASYAWLVPAGDTAALAAAMRDVLSRPGEARERAAAARRVLDERFGSARWLAELDEVWECVAGANRVRAAVPVRTG